MRNSYNIAFACLQCCKSFKRDTDITKGFIKELKCPECGGVSYNVGRHFKAPKKTDTKQWNKVAYLIKHGFHFQKIYDQDHDGQSVPYPDTLQEAKKFVIKYKRYAIESQ